MHRYPAAIAKAHMLFVDAKIWWPHYKRWLAPCILV